MLSISAYSAPALSAATECHLSSALEGFGRIVSGDVWSEQCSGMIGPIMLKQDRPDHDLA